MSNYDSPVDHLQKSVCGMEVDPAAEGIRCSLVSRMFRNILVKSNFWAGWVEFLSLRLYEISK